ncbi:MAG: hypothetical protein KC505_07420 [Myxococcales bacterium]|nr:hypothetical protein [Myxococcales bacterium]USN50634.1 MAG: hypothetical protein H6731_10285 [Myxococcales bacterium]
MKRLYLFCFLIFSLESQAIFKTYAVGNLGAWYENKTAKLEKYGGGLGLEFDLFSMFSVGAEITYTKGVTSDPIPYLLMNKISSESYGGFKENGKSLVKVHYFDLWLRPKLIIPIPIIQPYLVTPLSLLSYGGMQGYSTFGLGVGVLAGVQVAISSFSIFVESGIAMHSRKAKENINEGPPWGMFDFTLPVTMGLGYSF